MKNSLDELAVFGGTPTFSNPLHVGAPNLGHRGKLMERINDILDSRWFTNNGRHVREFEERIARLLSVRNCVATTNGTIALELAIRALNLEGEVIVPSFTFIATVHALQWQQITPVFCDIDPVTHHIDPGCIERLITSRTTGIIGVHTWGDACSVAELTDVATRNNLALLFDAAHAMGSSYRGQMIGNFGRAECLSFHATKFCTSFEGGAITTNDDELAAKLRLMRNFGFDGPDSVIHVGTNGKMCEISAAMGITSLESMPEFIDANLRNYQQYLAELTDIPGVELYRHNEMERNNYQYVVGLVDPIAAGISRDSLLAVLTAENILARKYFFPGCHRMEPYRSNRRREPLQLPHTEAVADEVLVLPTGMSTDSESIRKVCEVLRFATRNGSQIAERITDQNCVD